VAFITEPLAVLPSPTMIVSTPFANDTTFPAAVPLPPSWPKVQWWTPA